MGRLICSSLDRFWYRGSHAERLLRSHLIVLTEPRIDYNLHLPGGLPPLGVEHLTPQRSVETLIIFVLRGDPG